MLLSVSDAVNQIKSNPSPVLFLDTCAILDIFRAAIRENISNEIVSSAINLSSSTWLIINETISLELNNNEPLVLEDLKKKIKDTDEINRNFFTVVNMLFPTPIPPPQHISTYNIDILLSSLVNNLKSKCLELKREDHHSSKAMTRVISATPPSSKAKQSAKDCEVFETFLDLSANLRSNGFTDHIIFVSSNTNDYGAPTSSPLINEFSNLQTRYVTNLAWAISIIEGRVP